MFTQNRLESNQNSQKLVKAFVNCDFLRLFGNKYWKQKKKKRFVILMYTTLTKTIDVFSNNIQSQFSTHIFLPHTHKSVVSEN